MLRGNREIATIPFYLKQGICADEGSMGSTGYPVIHIVSEEFYQAFSNNLGAVRIEVMKGLNLDIFWWKKGLGILKNRQVFLALVEERDNKRNLLNILTRQDTTGFLGLPRFTRDNLLYEYHYLLAQNPDWDTGILLLPPKNSPRNFFSRKMPLLLDSSLDKKGINLQQTAGNLEIALPLPYFWAHPSQSPQFDHLALIFPRGAVSPNNARYELHVRMGYSITPQNHRISMGNIAST